MIQTFNEYQKEAVNLRISLVEIKKKYPELPENLLKLIAITYDGLGLGEAGEIQGKIKKIIRDNGGIITKEHKEAISFEIGDELWYLVSLCDNLNISLEDIANKNIEKLKSRRDRNTLHGNGDNR